MLLTTLAFCCLTALPSDVPSNAEDRVVVAVNHSEETTVVAKAEPGKLPNAPIANAIPATTSGARKYANDAIVRSVMCPSDNV